MRGPTQCQPVKLTDQHTLHDTMTIVRQQFTLTATGYLCQTDDLWRILLTAAARHSTIEAACADLLTAPASNTVRGYLAAQLTPQTIGDLERRWNDTLALLVPEWLYARPQEIALDFHDEPYYGRTDPDDPNNWVCRGEARAGTTRFYRCATAYIMQRNVRLTLAVVFVKPSDDTVRVLDRLLARVQAAGIRIKCLYADKGFCSIPLLRRLLSLRLPAIIATPVRGKQGGTRALCQGRTSYATTHTFRSAEHGELTVPVTVARTYKRQRSGRRRATWCVYVCLGVQAAAPRIRKRYRRRFGVESSYRLMEQVRARTSTPNPAVRFLLMGLALLIVNMWIRLHWLFLRIPGPGPRRVAHWTFRLDRMARFLTRAVERFYGVVSAVEPPLASLTAVGQPRS
jgi:Transposase DDE domain